MQGSQGVQHLRGHPSRAQVCVPTWAVGPAFQCVITQALGLTKRPVLEGFKVTGQLPSQLRAQHWDFKANPPTGARGEPWGQGDSLCLRGGGISACRKCK